MALTRNDFHIGQTVWLRPLCDYKWVGNERIRNYTPIPTIVVKIGRKYVTTQEDGKSWTEKRFSIDTVNQGRPFLHEHVSVGKINYDLYLTEQDAIDETEREQLIRAHRELFSMWNDIPCTVQQLRESAKILMI